MPTYAYRCEACGHAADEWLKMSEATAERSCPACGAASYRKQVTAPAFQLKGSGWYVTDFRGEKKTTEPASDKAAERAEKKAAETSAAASAPAAAGAASPAPAPAAAPAATPTAGTT
ncbi:FmdB family zinc ribbon protein [Derxia lacustris]|uniref:FmdB family zinc ribbon protein n=1 Tax=Derxia lacustris TaxID=764842 RepID=UPI000A172C4B|nr:FmdB family zinc ribbon protein [Derxia lacustris]